MDRMLQFFEYDHLPPELALISAKFFQLAHHLTETLPQNPERTVMLRKLLEAKDCAVRCKISVETPVTPVTPTGSETA